MQIQRHVYGVNPCECRSTTIGGRRLRVICVEHEPSSLAYNMVREADVERLREIARVMFRG